MKYGNKMKGSSGKVMGHAGSVSKCETMAPQKRDMGRLQRRPMEYRGNSDKAFAYKY